VLPIVTSYVGFFPLQFIFAYRIILKLTTEFPRILSSYEKKLIY